MERYIVAIDQGFQQDLTELKDHPNREMVWTTMIDEQQHAEFSSDVWTVENRALQVIKVVENMNGLETWRHLTLSLRLVPKSRGFALISTATAWPGFQMGQSLQPQLLKLEEMFEEARKAGTPLQEELTTAVLLKCVSGQFKTCLSVNLRDDVKYEDMREAALKWYRRQQRWSASMLPSSHDDYVGHDDPMEIDRIKGSRRAKTARARAIKCGKFGHSKRD